MPHLFLILFLFTSFALAAAPDCGSLFDDAITQEAKTKAVEVEAKDKFDLGEDLNHLLQGIVSAHVTVNEIKTPLIQKAFQSLAEVMDPTRTLFLESDIAFLRNIKADKAADLLMDIIEKKDYSKLITLVKRLEQRRQQFFDNLSFIEGSQSQRRIVYNIASKHNSTERVVRMNGRLMSFEAAIKYIHKYWSKTKEQDFEQLKVILASYMIPSLRANMSEADAFSVALAHIRRDLKEDVSVRGDPRIFVYLAKALFKNLDPHSEFASPKEFSEYNIKVSRRTPLGIYPIDSPRGLFLTRLDENSLAAKAGLQAGDTIVSINSVEATRFMHQGLTKFLRAQANPILKLVIERDGKQQPLLLDRSLHIFKEQVPVRFSLENDIATIGFNSFYFGVSKDVKTLVIKAIQQNAKGIVLDLRHNGGGILYDANQILKLFIKTSEPMWYNKTNNGIETSEQSQLGAPKDHVDYTQIFDGKIVVLVDNLSASASELTASVLQSFGRGIVVGSRATFGKGSTQARMKMKLGGLKITSGLFYNRLGESPQYHGVESDIVIARAEVSGAEKLERDLPGVIIAEDIARMTTDPTPVITEIDALRQKSLERQKLPRENVEDPVMNEAIRILSDWLALP